MVSSPSPPSSNANGKDDIADELFQAAIKMKGSQNYHAAAAQFLEAARAFYQIQDSLEEARAYEEAYKCFKVGKKFRIWGLIQLK